MVISAKRPLWHELSENRGNFESCWKFPGSHPASIPIPFLYEATGSGKTFTAITSLNRLLKHARAKRILILVDNLPSEMLFHAASSRQMKKPWQARQIPDSSAVIRR